MKEKIKIDLGDVQRTLLIPLFGRAKEYEKEHPLIKDKYAHDIVERLDFDFNDVFKHMPVQISVNSAIRAYHLDAALSAFIKKYPDATIVNLGAGLDTTFHRIDNGKIFWYDLDLPDSMELRLKLIPEGERNKSIAKSVFDRSWFQEIKERRSKIFFMSAGVFVYLQEEEIKGLFLDLIREFPGSEIMFDAYSKPLLWLRNNVLITRIQVQRSKLLARWHWGVNSGKAIARWSDEISVVDEFPYYSGINLEEFLDKKIVSSFQLLNFFRAIKMVHLKFG
ncbi:MAG TPA: class I SAM-dependent methyltransferase [Bacteroidota bacterium]|nr:class I SAM-dependent methyltransferase [Bacteroidota bacterium]